MINFFPNMFGNAYTEDKPKYSEKILRCLALRISDIVDGDTSNILERALRLTLLGYS
jgi:hypothetical protein